MKLDSIYVVATTPELDHLRVSGAKAPKPEFYDLKKVKEYICVMDDRLEFVEELVQLLVEQPQMSKPVVHSLKSLDDRINALETQLCKIQEHLAQRNT